MNLFYIIAALLLNSLIVAIMVGKHSYSLGFQHGWVSGATYTVRTTRSHGLQMAEHVLNGMRKRFGDDPSLNEEKPRG